MDMLNAQTHILQCHGIWWWRYSTMRLSFKTSDTLSVFPMNSLLPDAGRNPFYVVAPAYTQTSAGVRCLHLLRHSLNRSGEQAYFGLLNANAHSVNPDLRTSLLTNGIIDLPFSRNTFASRGVFLCHEVQVRT
jgi:hypothetical protein